jgi:hypothetical protein
MDFENAFELTRTGNKSHQAKRTWYTWKRTVTLGIIFARRASILIGYTSKIRSTIKELPLSPVEVRAGA